jgi:HK97 family phage major capsid protein
MKKSDQLKLERSAKVQAQGTLIQLAKTEKREFTTEENTHLDAIDGEIVILDGQIASAEKTEVRELRAVQFSGKKVTAEGDSTEQREERQMQKRFSILKVLRSINPATREELDGVEKEINEIGIRESRNANVDIPKDTGFSLPIFMLRAAQQTVSQDAGAFGGALVQNAAPIMIDNLRPRLFLETLGATFITGLQGGDVPLIVKSDFAMEFLAEGASITRQKKQYAGPSLTPKRAGGAVDISNRLLMQASPDVEQMVFDGLRNGFSTLLESAAINGAGGVAPLGLLSYLNVNASATVASAAATYALICELQGLIEAADSTENNLGYIMHPKLKAVLKQLKKDAGSGQFVYQDGLLDGYKAVSTTLMPVLNAGANYPLIFGDFSQMTIGQFGALNFKVNPYSADLEDSVRITLNTHADMQIANPKSFAKNNFLTV